jgi:beta-N-acetylhexosaminidase
MSKKIWWPLLVCCFLFKIASAQTPKEKWVDSVFNTLNVPEKVAQLFIISASPNADNQEINQLKNRVENDKIGGIIFTTGSVLNQVNLTNQIQSSAKVPLFIGADCVSGLGSQLDSTLRFPSAVIQGALTSDSTIYKMAKEIGREMRLIGINMNFASIGNLAHDSTISPVNSYGTNTHSVTSKSLAYLNGLKSEGILATAKYFPISAVTITDFEKKIPITKPSEDTLLTAPFKKLFINGLDGIIPSSSSADVHFDKKVSSKKNDYSGDVLAALFSADWLRSQPGYNGLVVADLQHLKSADNPGNGNMELLAFQKGNDLILTSSDIAPALRKIKKLLRKQKQYLTQLDQHVRKVLAAKYDAGLNKKKIIATENLLLKLNPVEARIFRQKMFQSAVTVSRNRENTLPVKSLDNKNFVCLVAGDTAQKKIFQKFISNYTPVSGLLVNDNTPADRIAKSFNSADVMIVALFDNTSSSTIQKILAVADSLKKDKELIICDFGSELFKPLAERYPTVIHAYMGVPEMLRIVPQVIFGGLPAEGVLPFSVGGLKDGTGISTISLNRFQYSIPADAGMDEKTLAKIASIAKEAIDNGATPGCNVLVAKDGKIVYQKSFGYLTYEKQSPVTDTTIYDLASVTKVSATLQTVMFMYEKGLIDVNKKVSVYLPELKNSNKKDFTIKDILTHQAGLWPFLPFWAQTMKDSVHLPLYYNKKPTREYPFVVSDKLYAATSMKDSLWSWIIHAKIREKPARTPYDYKYSDMGFYVMQHLAEKLLNQPIEDFLAQNLYEPLGANTTGYLPLLRFPIGQIAPTENDKLFRKALLIGTVHDQGAAMHGGVAGHAGLFSSALDLAKLGQMLLQEGNYGGYQFYKPETVRFFTQKQFETSRRGLGWDKSTPGDWNGPTSIYASPRTFGHTGFTGTCIWVDPEFNLVYIFLSNRVHPDMTNNKLLTGNIRSRIQDVIYQSIFDYCKGSGSQSVTGKEVPLTTSKSIQ